MLNALLEPRTTVYSPSSINEQSSRMISKIRFSDGRLECRSNCESKTNLIRIESGDLVISGINALKGAVALNLNDDPHPLFATIHYSSYGITKGRVEPQFLWYLLRSKLFREIAERQLPNGIKTELKPKRLLGMELPIPNIIEQRRIISHLDQTFILVSNAKVLNKEIKEFYDDLLFSLVSEISLEAPRLPLKEIAPIIRRKVEIEKDAEYPELGIRSFGVCYNAIFM